MKGAPLGNQNAAKAKVWTLAIQKALEKRSRVGRMEALEVIADQLIEKCMEGDLEALKELGNRLEGKPSQSIDANVSGGLTVNIVKFGNHATE